MLRVFTVVVALAGCSALMAGTPTLMTTDEAMNMPRPAADLQVSYGADPLNFGQLRLPDGDGPFPVVVVVHGGCWLAEYDLGYISALASRLTSDGVATWSIEYRRVGDTGGGWPGTFVDVADAADHLKVMAPEAGLDLDRVVAMGHSAGGHLALWLAGRDRLAEDDPLRGKSPLQLCGVVALAGIADLAAYASPEGCGAAVPQLLGGQPEEVGNRVRRASPSEMLPLGVPQVLVAGRLDPIVPLAHTEKYAASASKAGDAASVEIIEGAGHFELVNPDHEAYAVIRDAVFWQMGLRVGP